MSIALLSFFPCAVAQPCGGNTPPPPGCTEVWTPHDDIIPIELSSNPPCSIYVHAWWMQRCNEIQYADMDWQWTFPPCFTGDIHSWETTKHIYEEVRKGIVLRNFLVAGPSNYRCPNTFKEYVTKNVSCYREQWIFTSLAGGTITLDIDPLVPLSTYIAQVTAQGGMNNVSIHLEPCSESACCTKGISVCWNQYTASMVITQTWYQPSGVDCLPFGTCHYNMCED